MTNRWVLNRVGLLNFWYYAKEIFEFANGKMLLRGTNGSGKSLTMQSLFPVLFDGDTSAYRLDSFGSRDRRMEDYLLGEKGVSERDEGIGYLFLEVKRENRAEYLTVGIGMHANRGGTLKKWFFAIENNRRIGIDFELYEELRRGEFTPLTKKKLRNRLEGKGRIFETQRDYKTFVNQRIFGFDNLDQFDELITLLLQLRSPKLSKDFRPSVIYGILRNSLPKLKDDDLLPLSKTIEQLDLHREQLDNLSNEIKQLDQFAKNYQRWQNELLAQVAGKWEQLAATKAKMTHLVSESQRKLTAEEAAKIENQQAISENEQQLTVLAATISQLSQHEGMNLVSQGLELKQRLEQTTASLQRTKDQLSKKQQQLHQQQQELTQREVTREALLADLSDILTDNQQYVSYLRFEELDRVYQEKLPDQLTLDEQKYWLEQTQQKQAHFREIHALLLKIAELKEQLIQLERNVGQLQQEFDELQRDLRHWQQTREDEVEKWKLAVDGWQETAPFQLSSEQYNELLQRINGLLEEEEREEIVLTPLTEAYHTALKNQQLALVPLENDLSVNQVQIKELQKEIKAWQNQKSPEPRRYTTRIENRANWPAKGERVLFYQGVDFQEQIPEAERNKIEGALFAAGILDGVISQEKLQLADDIMIEPQPQILGLTLGKVMKVNPDLSQTLQAQVENVLDSIFYNDPAPQADLPSIQPDGSYRIGNLIGEGPKDYQASFIGVASQERYRQAQIARLKSAVHQLEEENHALEEKIHAGAQLIQQIERAYSERPHGQEVYQTYSESKNVTLALQAKEKELLAKTAETNDLQQRVFSLKNQLIQETKEDQLVQEVAAYEEALLYAQNYEENLRNAFSRSTEIRQQTEMLASIGAHLENYRSEEAELLYSSNEMTSEVGKLQRLLEANAEQQKIVNVAELTAKLTAASDEQTLRQKQTKGLNQTQIEIEKTITKITSQLAYDQTELNQIAKQEINWRLLLENELQRADQSGSELSAFAKEKGKELNFKELKRLADLVSTRFNFLADQLQNYQPKLLNVSGVELTPAEEQALGEFSSFNNHNEPRFTVEGQPTITLELLERLREQRLTLRELLKKDDEQLFKKIILESVGKVLRSRIHQAQQWVEKMNDLLQGQRNSSGLSLSISWKGAPATSDADISTNQLVILLEKPSELLSESDRETVSRHFQEKVRLAQEQLQNDSDDRSTLFQAISEVLDYRDWFEFELKYKRANEGYQPQALTDRRFNQFSGGEKAIAMYLPLFAATYSRYEDAGEQCPRVITLDEAFAGIDDQNIAELFKACEQLGFNFVMNSQALFGDYPTVSSLAIYELLRPQNVNFVTTIRYSWDGQQKRLLTGAE